LCVFKFLFELNIYVNNTFIKGNNLHLRRLHRDEISRMKINLHRPYLYLEITLLIMTSNVLKRRSRTNLSGLYTLSIKT